MANAISEIKERHATANQQIKVTAQNVGEIYEDVRLRLNQRLQAFVLSGDRNKYRGKALVDCIEAIGQIYHEFEEKFREEMGRAVPYVAEAYYQDALHDMGEKITGKFDTKRAESMLQDSYSHIAGATEFMSATQVGNLRNIVSRVLRTAGMTGMTSREVQGELLRLLTADFTFTDAKGRVWNTEAYTKMLARTTLMNAGRESYLDTCADKGKDVVRISISGDACPKCTEWENRLVSLSGKTKGLPLLQDAIDGGLFHPNCTHSTVAVGDWDRETKFDKNGRPKEGWNSAKNPNPKGDDPDANREYRRQQAEKAKKTDTQNKISKGGQQNNQQNVYRGYKTKTESLEKLHIEHVKHRQEQLKKAKQNRLQKEAALCKAPLIKGKHSIEEDLRNTNPHYNPNVPEYSENCQRCITAYEARRRGIDVEAKPRGWRLEKIARSEQWTMVYKNPQIINCSAASGKQAKAKILSELEKMPDGARCGVQVLYPGGGHVFIAERINGKTYFFDPQIKGDKRQKNAESHLNGIKKDFACICRLDNLKFNDNIYICVKKRS